MPASVPPSRRPGGPARPRTPLLHWPAITAALVIAILFVAVLVLFLKNRELHDVAEQMAHLQGGSPEQQKKDAPPAPQDELLSLGKQRELPNDSAEEIDRVLGHGMNSDVQSELLDPAELKRKRKPSIPPKPQPKEAPPADPKPQPKEIPPAEPKPQPKEIPPAEPKPQPKEKLPVEPKPQPKENPPAEPKPQPPPKPPEVTVAPPPPKPPVPPPAPKPSPADELFELKRLHQSEEDLRTQLLDVPELRVLSDLEIQVVRDQQAATATRRAQTGNLLVNPDALKYAFNAKLQVAFRQAAAKAGLSLQLGPKAQLDRTSASGMQVLSKQLRDMGFVSIPGLASTVRSPSGQVIKVGGTTLAGGSAPEKVAAFKEWCKVNEVEKFRGALATMLQMLQVEDAPTRLLLVRELKHVKGPVTSAVLAMRAVADLSPEVREKAIDALQKRLAAEYLPLLLLGLRYPWPPVADHAAYALMKLKPDGAVPKLVDLLDQPDPSVPVLDKRTNKPMVKEMVRLNHMRNCLLCHAPSGGPNDGLVRGAVPTPGQPLPPAYYQAQTGDFVRADITFLRQDFSVILPVKAASPWPDEQRFDFITRVRPAKEKELKPTTVRPANYPQREAVLYALRGLTGKDGGDASAKWRDMLDIAQDKGADKTVSPAKERAAPSEKPDTPAKEKDRQP